MSDAVSRLLRRYEEVNQQCHSERSEESRSGSDAAQATGRARFLASLGMTLRWCFAA
jgi:hypothetical protein